MGGIWKISPRNRSSAASSSSRDTEVSGSSRRIWPVTSWVLVTSPSRSPAAYSLSPSVENSTARVARPTKTGSTPVAMGSRVPPWPMRFS